jgi:hypothetical protein
LSKDSEVIETRAIKSTNGERQLLAVLHERSDGLPWQEFMMGTRHHRRVLCVASKRPQYNHIPHIAAPQQSTMWHSGLLFAARPERGVGISRTWMPARPASRPVSPDDADAARGAA